jgi:hypothetical protein
MGVKRSSEKISIGELPVMIKFIGSGENVPHMDTLSVYECTNIHFQGVWFYRIVLDGSDYGWYDSKYFKRLSDFRNEKLEELLK